MTLPIFVDTSYILALVNRSDSLHERARQASLRVMPPFLTTEAVLTENLSTAEPMSPLETLIRHLQAELPTLREQYDVERLAIFGSYAHNEQRSGSDLDLLVTFRTTPLSY